MIIIQKHQEVYGNIIEMNQLWLMLVLSLIFFFAADNSALLKIKQKITGKTAANGRKDVKIIVPLKYLNNFWKTLKMPLN